MYLPAGPSGHIISSKYDLCSIITWIFYYFLYILVRLLFLIRSPSEACTGDMELVVEEALRT